MKRQPSPRKQGRATVWTDFCRLVLCGVGCISIYLGVTGYLDEEKRWSLGAMIFCVGLGLVFIAVGTFAKPKTAVRAAESISP